MKTVHVIFNAHLDPIWLWPWQSGLDELLNTCRTACDLLEKHPDLIFTRGEAWVYQQIEKVSPTVFRRIGKLVEAGRWEIVGGWWIQPDCNLPSGFAFERQIALGKEYFLSRFGFFPEVGYNVDSFGHAATLPGYMTAAGQKYYVMMRPGPEEKTLPARLFRWRGYASGPAVTTCRITFPYNAFPAELPHFEKALAELPDGCAHTMCFVGVGDHGGGPTEQQLEWVRRHQDALPGARLVISSPARFFKAIEAAALALPVVTGDLQPHAVGCYTIHRPVKVAVRRAEYRLAQAEVMRAALGSRADDLPALQRGWQNVCFHHFHDTLGGTCIPSAYPVVLAQLGEAVAAADENLQIGLRRLIEDLPANLHQRIIAYNASEVDLDGYIEFEPWLDWRSWKQGGLFDESGERISQQILHSEALIGNLTRLLFPLEIKAGAMRILELRHDVEEATPPSSTTAHGVAIGNEIGVSVEASADPSLRFAALDLALSPQLELIDDPSDTWGHDVHRFSGQTVARCSWDKSEIIDAGPLMSSLFQRGEFSRSRVTAEWRVYAGKPWVELTLMVNWQELHKVLKLTLATPPLAGPRVDGILGGALTRDNRGMEAPIQNWTLLPLADDVSLGIVCPDVFALDVDDAQVRLTLLRSSLLAHHDPYPGKHPRAVTSDQGTHEFRFRFWVDHSLTPAALASEAAQMQFPPVLADATNGMPGRWREIIAE